jgi:predicted DNA-binding protein YlxM (UPF0122 family)
MMKKHEDCASCFSEKSAVYKTDIKEEIRIKGFKKFTIQVSGWICKECKEVYYGPKESGIYDKLVAEEKAKQLAEKVHPSDLCSVKEVAKTLNVTRQMVDKILRRGAIDYVVLGDQRFPLKKSVDRYKQLKTA